MERRGLGKKKEKFYIIVNLIELNNLFRSLKIMKKIRSLIYLILFFFIFNITVSQSKVIKYCTGVKEIHKEWMGTKYSIWECTMTEENVVLKDQFNQVTKKIANEFTKLNNDLKDQASKEFLPKTENLQSQIDDLKKQIEDLKSQISNLKKKE